MTCKNLNNTRAANRSLNYIQEYPTRNYRPEMWSQE